MEDLVDGEDLRRSATAPAAARAFRAPEASEIAAAIRKLPPLPALLQELLRELQDQDADIGRLEERIASDPGLTTRVLKMANSPFYARSAEVVDVRRAVLTLGFRTVANLVVAAGLRSTMTSTSRVPGFERNGIFLHSLATGLACSRLGNFVPLLREHRESLFVAGVMHDVGRVALAEFYTGFGRQLTDREDLMLGPEVERRFLETDHQVVGRQVREQWGLPVELEPAITRHHEPVEAIVDDAVTLAVALADAVLNRQGLARTHSQANDARIDALCEALGAAREQTDEKLANIDEELRSIAGAFA